MITEERFKVLQHIREYIFRVDASLENFPKKEIEIKVRIRENLYELLLVAYEANITSDIERKKELLERSITKVKVLDFLLNMSLEKKLITGKKYLKFGEKMNDIMKYLSGWLKKIKEGNNI